MNALCRDCLSGDAAAGGECPACGGQRIVGHPELDALTVAHIDCDAFYANVEKRDNPDIADHPVIVGGGGKRGVVLTCCYIARRYGVHSAMPMYRALKACPTAVIIRPEMGKYGRIGREVRDIMLEATPAVEPLSVDEAFLDLAGTERLHGGSPARTLAELALAIESRIGITVSVGLSYNKFLAKIASGLDKPRGFAVIGRAEAIDFLAAQGVGVLWGVGPALKARLTGDGIETVGDLQSIPEAELVRRYGSIGARLARFSWGRDSRRVSAGTGRKSLSSERTFSDDVADARELERRLWPLCENVASGLKKEALGARTVTLKLKTADFRLRTRSLTLPNPTALAEVIYRVGRALLANEADGTRFRLMGIGASRYVPAAEADPPDLADPDSGRRKDIEAAVDALRARFGREVIGRGRGLES